MIKYLNGHCYGFGHGKPHNEEHHKWKIGRHLERISLQTEESTEAEIRQVSRHCSHC